MTGLDPVPALDRAARHIVGDLSDQRRITELLRAENVTHVIHCGGISGPMVLSDDPARVMDINVTGSLNLLQAALARNVKTFVYCSSVSAIGDFYENKPIDDSYPLHPTSAYGCSKAAVDMVLLGLYRRVPLDLCSLRFTSIYGPGRRTRLVVDDIVAAAAQGKPALVQSTTDWPYIYIDDAADAAVSACFSERRRQLFYFIAYPEQVNLTTWLPRRPGESRSNFYWTKRYRAPRVDRSTLRPRGAISTSHQKLIIEQAFAGWLKPISQCRHEIIHTPLSGQTALVIVKTFLQLLSVEG